MAQDLKIQIRKILALHEVSLHLEHAIRESKRPDDPWQDFTPSRFIYAYFTFNTIYSWDWKTSFELGHLVGWKKKSNGHSLSEEEQLKNYVRFCSDTLAPDSSKIFGLCFVDACKVMGLSDPADKMTELDITNADKKLKKLEDQMPVLVQRLYEGELPSEQFYTSACHVLKFIYGVRCNLFHGRKTHVEMLDGKQQERLLVYAALLVATNGLLFDVTEKLDIGFMPVHIKFLKGYETTNGSVAPK